MPGANVIFIESSMEIVQKEAMDGVDGTPASYDTPGWDITGDEFSSGDWTFVYHGDHNDKEEKVSRLYVSGYTGTKSSIVIPDTVNGKKVYGVTYASNRKPQDCWNVKELTISAGILALGSGAFEGCASLERVYFDQNKTISDLPVSNQ